MADNLRTISFVKGKGNLNHNNRIFIAKNVDTNRTKNNIIFKQEKLEDAYQVCFGKSIEEYNAKQKRKDRQKSVEKYIEEIQKNQKKDGSEKLFYEQLVQIGDMHDSGVKTNPAEAEKCKEILEKYMQGFQARNPNLYCFNSVIHMDEATPHLHLDFIPCAKGYKQGVKTRNSLTRALQEMGIEKGEGTKQSNEFVNWKKREVAELKKICESYGVKIKTLGEKRKNLTIDEYREAGKLADKQIEQLIQERKLFTEEQVKEIVRIELQKAEEIKKLQEKLLRNSPTDGRKDTGTMSDTPEKQNNLQSQQQSITVPEEKQQPELSQPYQPYVSKFRPNEWAFRMIESEIKSKEEQLQLKKRQLEKLKENAAAAVKDSWNVFKSSKQIRAEYLKKHKAPELEKEIVKLDAELQQLKKRLEQAETKSNLIGSVPQPATVPEEKMTVAHEQQQTEQKKVKNKLVIQHKEKDNVRTRGGLSR